MITQIIVLVLGTITFLTLNLIFKKSKSSKLKNNGLKLSILISVVLSFVLFFIPFENAFISFSTPQKAFHYYTTGEIKAILDGENSTMIISGEDNEDQINIFPKTKDKTKWKIGMGYNIKSVAKFNKKNVYIDIDTYSHSDDYYIYINICNVNECKIYDSCDSEFKVIENENTVSYKTYAAYIKDFDKNYTLSVNGEEIQFKTQETKTQDNDSSVCR